MLVAYCCLMSSSNHSLNRTFAFGHVLLGNIVSIQVGKRPSASAGSPSACKQPRRRRRRSLRRRSHCPRSPCTRRRRSTPACISAAPSRRHRVAAVGSPRSRRCRSRPQSRHRRRRRRRRRRMPRPRRRSMRSSLATTNRWDSPTTSFDICVSVDVCRTILSQPSFVFVQSRCRSNRQSAVTQHRKTAIVVRSFRITHLVPPYVKHNN
jgi:hypothetical protein